MFVLMSCTDMHNLDIIRYREEFIDNGEDCYVLWLLKEMEIGEWKENARKDRRTRYVGMYVDAMLVGIGRITLRLNNEASGKIGYAIRPSERGKGYAQQMIKMMTDACDVIGVPEPTACVDEGNEKSIRAFRKAGWEPSGRVFDWKPNPGPRKAIEYVPKRNV